MITGFLNRWDQDKLYFPKAFNTAFVFLLEKDPLALERKKYAVDGDAVFLTVQDSQTKLRDEGRFEVHRDYIDIQILFKGREMHGYYPQTIGDILEDRLAANDVAFYTAPVRANFLILEPGQYAVYTPGELHAPTLAVAGSEKIVKAVVKIHKDCMNVSGTTCSENPGVKRESP